MSDGDVLPRRAERGDWRALKTIRLEALRDTPIAYGSSLDAAESFPDSRWQIMAAEHGYFLVERAGETIGLVAGGLHDERPGEHWLYGLYVTPRARGGAVATMLVDAVTVWGKSDGARSLYLDVTTSLARARAFYEKVGFRSTGERRVMERDPSLELMRMRKDLVGE